MEAGGVCLQKWRRRRRKRSETPAETVSKGWGGPSPPPGHGERPPGRDGMGWDALRGGRRGRRCQSRRREPADGKGRAQPSRAEPGVMLRMSGTERRDCSFPPARMHRGAEGDPRASVAAGIRSVSRHNRRGLRTSGCAADAGTAGRFARMGLP